LEAARRLFAERGYVATSMTAIAEEAGTAVQTIYDSVGPKRAILLALVEASEEEVGVMAYVQRLMQTQDPREAVGIQVEISRQFAERFGDVFVTLMSAAPTDPDVAEAWQRANMGHRTGAGFVVKRLVELGALRGDMPVERAADIVGALTWGATWQQFIRIYGWSLDDCDTWMKETLQRLLLRSEVLGAGDPGG
jgi:AcrR family transcriptional regulator